MAAKLILVVEDNDLNLELTTDLLEAAGYAVCHARNAQEGIQSAKTHRPCLILMDLSLPGMDGLEATRILKRDPDTSRIPIVALTAHAMRGDEEKARSAGCAGYLTKPIDTRKFSETIGSFIKTAKTSNSEPLP